MTHAIFCGSSSCVLCDFTEVKYLEETDSGAEKGHPIHLCASQSINKKEKSQEEERKENANQVPNQKQKLPNHREQRTEERNIQRKHLLLKNTVCVRKTQSCLIAVHLKESCQVFVSPLRKRVKMSPMDLSQRLTSSELFH